MCFLRRNEWPTSLIHVASSELSFLLAVKVSMVFFLHALSPVFYMTVKQPVHFVAFSFTVSHCWVFDFPKHGCRWENQLKRITLGKRSVNKGRVEEGVEKILPTSGYRFELLTHSDSPPNKYMTLTLLFFWSWVGDFLIGMYFFPLT